MTHNQTQMSREKKRQEVECLYTPESPSAHLASIQNHVSADMRNNPEPLNTVSLAFPGNPTLARAYVVNQRLCSVYNLADAFKAGTLFPELYRPYP